MDSSLMNEIASNETEVRKVVIDIPDDTPAKEISDYLQLLREHRATVSAEVTKMNGNLVIVREFRV